MVNERLVCGCCPLIVWLSRVTGVCWVGEGKVLNEGVKVGKEGNETFHYSLSWSVMNGTDLPLLAVR